MNKLQIRIVISMESGRGVNAPYYWPENSKIKTLFNDPNNFKSYLNTNFKYF